MSPPVPSKAELTRLVSLAMSRGLPPPDAEDVVARSYERAAAAYDPGRGAFGALLQRVVQREAVEWWRTRLRGPDARTSPLGSVPAAPSPEALEVASANQRRLLDALGEDERQVFAAWALQKVHPDVDAAVAAGRVGLTVREFDNAKRRLKDRIRRLAASWGLEPRDFFSVTEDEGPRPREAIRG
jgi:DNA-directed RNA polymerase specialized sigma24 family protein